jgi:hypothetical protein
MTESESLINATRKYERLRFRGKSDNSKRKIYIGYDNYTCDEYHLCENYDRNSNLL